MIEVLEENRGKLCDAALASGFLAMTPKAQARKKERREWPPLEFKFSATKTHKQPSVKVPKIRMKVVYWIND